MAEKKYDLLLGPKRDSNLKIRNQPWYRERLLTKYDRKPTLDASSWTFIKDGLDDFRDGQPPTIDDSIVIKGKKGVLPSVVGSNSFDGVKTNQRTKKIINKHEAIYSKTIPNQERRRKKVDSLEKNLLRHPLALYPHIGQSVPPDVFEGIVGLLDPSMFIGDNDDSTYDFNIPSGLNLNLTDAERDNSTGYSLRSTSASKSPTDSVKHEPIPGYRQAIRNVFSDARSDSKKLEELSFKEEKQNRTGRRKTLPLSNQFNATSLSNIDCVTKEFCDWVSDLGGEVPDIEEDTVKNLFASGCDTNPVLSAPVHVVELTNVPPDLRTKDITSNPLMGDVDLLKQSYVPSWSKMKYGGAWYLKPKLWKARPAGELLQDPKEIEGKKISETREKSKELDLVLATSHGAQSFRKFIDKKGARKPVFFESIPTGDENGPSNRVNKMNFAKSKIKC